MIFGANIAESYDDYLQLGFALANGLGEDGGDIYHKLCAQSAKYREVSVRRSGRSVCARTRVVLLSQVFTKWHKMQVSTSRPSAGSFPQTLKTLRVRET